MFRIFVKIIQAYRFGALELGILPRTGAQIKNEKQPDPELKESSVESLGP